MSTHAKKRPLAAFAAVTAALSLLAASGCGSQGDGGQAAPRPSKSPSASKTPSPTPTPTPFGQSFDPAVHRSAGAGPQAGARGEDRQRTPGASGHGPRQGRHRVHRTGRGGPEPDSSPSSRPSHPPTVGPVRSARESDLELLRQFGSPAFAYSGANSKVLPLIRKAPVHDVSPAHAGAPYFRGDSRPAPHNLYANTSGLLERAPEASKARDIGFRFGPAPAGGRADTSETVGYSSFRAAFRWSGEARRWSVAMDGKPVEAADGTPPRPSTVVVQYVDIKLSRFGDKWGSKSPYTKSIGSGKALVLRDGKAYDTRWSRKTPADGTTFTTADGKLMTFAPGQVWVVFAAQA